MTGFITNVSSGRNWNEQKGFVAFVRAEDDEFFLVGATVDEEDYLSVTRLLGLWERAWGRKKQNVKKTMVRIRLKATNSLRSLLSEYKDNVV
jgi:hypothetical protein